MLRGSPLIILLALIASARISAEVRSLALLVGVNEGLAEERLLKYAGRDAEGMEEALRESGTFAKEDVFLLANPTLDRFRSSIEAMRVRIHDLRRAGVQTSVLLYYSGHGSAGGLHMHGRNLPREEVNDLLGSLESDLKILILDACESGDFLRSKGGTFLQDREIAREAKLGSHGTIVLSSSSRGEAAQESEDYHGAIFTHHLVNGLRGMSDYNSDGQVTLLEAFEYARSATRAEAVMGRTERQNPSFDFDVVGESDPVLTRLDRKSSLIIFEGMPSVPLEVFNAQTLELEHRVWLTGKPQAMYRLGSGKYLVRYPDKENYRVGALDLTWSSEARMRPEDFLPRPKSLLQRKGGPGFNLNAHGIQISLRNDPPISIPALGAEYVLRDWPLKQALGFGVGRAVHPGGASGIDLDTRSFRLGYSLLYPLFASANGQFSFGAEAAWQRLWQLAEDRRFGPSGIMAEGKPVETHRESWSNVWSAGMPVELEIFLPGRMWIGASARAEAYLYRKRASGEYSKRFRLEPSLFLGHQF
jgi:hypothetical protein